MQYLPFPISRTGTEWKYSDILADEAYTDFS